MTTIHSIFIQNTRAISFRAIYNGVSIFLHFLHMLQDSNNQHYLQQWIDCLYKPEHIVFEGLLAVRGHCGMSQVHGGQLI